MKPAQLHALADAAHALLGAAEAAERAPAEYDEAALREMLQPLLQAALPLYTAAELSQFQIEAAIEAHGGNRAAAADAIGISRRCLYNHAPPKQHQVRKPRSAA